MAIKTVEIDNLENNQLYGFRMFPRNLKGQYQTRDDRGTATATPVAFSLPTYTGNHSIFGDINEGRIEMYTSGTLTLSAGTYDMFAVGGGGGGAGSEYAYTGSSGGGGGYTKTSKNVEIIKKDNIAVLIGGKGIGGTGLYAPSGEDGGTTSIQVSNSVKFEAVGGKGASNNINTHAGGGDGGSGGGGGNDRGEGGYGGSDGSNGGSRTFNGGRGQGTTTRAFGESTNTLYAGGGGGAGDTYQGSHSGGVGGSGGGGDGGNSFGGYVRGSDGTSNTGGGGGGSPTPNTNLMLDGGSGGSGIAIIRWKRK